MNWIVCPVICNLPEVFSTIQRQKEKKQENTNHCCLHPWVPEIFFYDQYFLTGKKPKKYKYVTEFAKSSFLQHSHFIIQQLGGVVVQHLTLLSSFAPVWHYSLDTEDVHPVDNNQSHLSQKTEEHYSPKILNKKEQTVNLL